MDAEDASMVNGREIPKKGDFVYWRTVGGKEHAGTVTDVDSNVLYVRCEDGIVRTAEW